MGQKSLGQPLSPKRRISCCGSVANECLSMIKLYASHSSEFFAAREPGRIHLYKDSFPDLTHRVSDRLAGDLIHLSDGGECFFRSDEGLFRLRREKGVRADRCKAVAALDGSPEGGVLRGFAVRADGEQVAYEQVIPAQKFSSKLKRFLGQKSAQGDVGPRLHRFIFSQWSGRSASCYYETVVDPRNSIEPIWWASADFGFLAVMERERDGRSLLQVIDIFNQTQMNDGLLVQGRLSRDRFLTSNGSVGFGLEVDGKRAFVIFSYNQQNFSVTYPKDSRVVHLGKDYVVFLSKRHHVVVKNYRNQVVGEANLRSLEELGVQFLMSFNRRGTLELVTYADGKLKVHHTDIESLPTDARRWELLVERQRAEALERRADQVLEREMTEARQSGHDARRTELMASMEYSQGPDPYQDSYQETYQDTYQEEYEEPTYPPEPTFDFPEDGALNAGATVAVEEKDGSLTLDTHREASEDALKLHFSSKDEALEALERLRMRYIAGELTREDYYNEKTLIERASAALSGQ